MNREIVLPCLLDRLLDDNPERVVENERQRAMSVSEYRAAVMRDLQWLLNASRHPESHDLYLFPEVATSVLNYGLRDYGGQVAEGQDPADMAREIKRAILLFEPRILPHSLRVVPVAQSDRVANLVFEIHAELWMVPYNQPLHMRTRLDLETGAYEVSPR